MKTISLEEIRKRIIERFGKQMDWENELEQMVLSQTINLRNMRECLKERLEWNETHFKAYEMGVRDSCQSIGRIIFSQDNL